VSAPRFGSTSTGSPARTALRPFGETAGVLAPGSLRATVRGLVRVLLATDLESVLEEVVIVEPDAATRDRHMDFFTRLAGSALVFVFANFAEVAQNLA
jgi:hypothetical protein